jgi:peptide/nickel transport system permease protein
MSASNSPSALADAVDEPSAQLSISTSRKPLSMRRATAPIVVAASVLLLLILLVVIGPFLLGDPNAQSLLSYRPPLGFGGSSAHILGTDQLGRDELVRSVDGLRTSLIVSSLATAIGGVLGVAFGMIAGFAGGLVDEGLMRLVDVFLAVPGIIVVLFLMSVLRPSFGSVIGVLALLAWIDFARVARAQALSFRENDMVIAERSLGASSTRILLRHVLPNSSGPLFVMTTLAIGNLIIVEAALGFLGFGVPPPTPSLGGMIADGKVGLLGGLWWLVIVPGALLAITIMVINVIGDWLRDRFDPRNSTLRT